MVVVEERGTPERLRQALRETRRERGRAAPWERETRVLCSPKTSTIYRGKGKGRRPRGNPRVPPPLPWPLYIVEGWEGSRTSSLAQPSPSSNTSSSSIVLGEALPENHEIHHHHAVVLLLDGVFPNLSLSPCYIKA